MNSIDLQIHQFQTYISTIPDTYRLSLETIENSLVEEFETECKDDPEKYIEYSGFYQEKVNNSKSKFLLPFLLSTYETIVDSMEEISKSLSLDPSVFERYHKQAAKIMCGVDHIVKWEQYLEKLKRLEVLGETFLTDISERMVGEKNV